MKDSKNLVIGMLCAVICIMAVAYAAFSASLEVNGTATITGGNWKVGFTEINCTDGEEDSEAPIVAAGKNGETSITITDGENAGTYTLGMTGGIEGTAGTSTSASFNATVLQPGDQVWCTVTVKNGGSKPAIVQDLIIDEEEDSEAPITYTVDQTSIAEGSTLASGGEATFKITATYDANTTKQPKDLDESLSITLIYVDEVQ